MKVLVLRGYCIYSQSLCLGCWTVKSWSAAALLLNFAARAHQQESQASTHLTKRETGKDKKAGVCTGTRVLNTHNFFMREKLSCVIHGQSIEPQQCCPSDSGIADSQM